MSTAEISPPPIPGSSSSTEKEQPEVPGHPPRSPTPEAVKCAICLEDLVNKSYSNSCCHQFCFSCLLEWSKVKPECPLCKSPFRSIFHNIRSISDYDEYVVPANIPHLSIRLTTSDRYSPDIMLIDRRRRLEEYRTALMDNNFDRFHSERYTRAFSDHLDPRNRIIRYLEVTERGNNFSLTSYRMERDANPFQSSDPEYFNPPSIDLTTESENYSGHTIPGYQSRRRIYDRNQYVLPFHSNLQPGTVFFPSVEYIRTHPAAMARVTPWLHRELLVLLGLTRSRSQLADIYDVILNLLQSYDIRSREFRSMTRMYFGNRVKHFQHEFYHYLLSGLRMTDYDNAAVYSSSLGHVSSAAAAPPVVTLDSDDDSVNVVMFSNGDDDDVILLDGENPVTSQSEATSSRRESRRFAEAYGSITPVTPIPVCPSVYHNQNNPGMTTLPLPPSWGVDRRPENGGDWMPWPPHHFNGVSNSYRPHVNHGHYHLQPFPTIQEIPSSSVDSENRSSALGPASSSSNIAALSPSLAHWSEPVIPPVVTGTESGGRSSGRKCRDKSDRRRRSKNPDHEPRSSKRLRSAAAESEGSGSGNSSHPPSKDTSSSYRIRLRGSSRNHGESSTSSRTVESSYPTDCSVTELTTGENYTYNSRPLSGSGIGVSIRIIGRSAATGSSHSEEDSPIIVSSSSQNHHPSSNANEAVVTLPIPIQEEVQIAGDSDEDCVLLGVHPVLKKPPLAVITISSDDEEEETRKRLKAEKKDRPMTETADPDSFLALFNSMESSSFQEGILDYSIPTFELETASQETMDKRYTDQLSTVSQKFFDSLAAESRSLQYSSFPAAPASTSSSASLRDRLGHQGKSGGMSTSTMSANHLWSHHPSSTSVWPSSSVITNAGISAHQNQTFPPSSPYSPTSPDFSLSPTYSSARPSYTMSAKNNALTCQLSIPGPSTSSRRLGNSSAPKFRAGMKRSSYYSIPLSSDQPSASLPPGDHVSPKKSTERAKTRSTAKAERTKEKMDEGKRSRSRSSHKKKGKHKKSKKTALYKKKSRKSKRGRLSSSSSSSESESDHHSDTTWIDDGDDSDFKETQWKVKDKAKVERNTRASKRNKDSQVADRKTSAKEKEKKSEKKSTKNCRVLDSEDSSSPEDNCPLIERLKGGKKRRRVFCASDSSEDERPCSSKDAVTNSNEKWPKPRLPMLKNVSSSDADLDSLPYVANTSSVANSQSQSPFDLSLDTGSHTNSRGGYSTVLKRPKHRWESDDSAQGADDPFILTPSTLGMHHVSSSNPIECHISDSSDNSQDEQSNFLQPPLTEAEMPAHEFSESFSQPYSTSSLVGRPGGNEMMLTTGSNGETSEDETGLLNLPYESMEQMAAAILARTIAVASNNAHADTLTHRSDTNSQLMLEDDEEAGLAGLDLSLGRYDIDNEGTPHTVTSSSNYSQRWWSQPTQDWDD